MKKKKNSRRLERQKIVVTKQCDDCEAHPVKRGKYLPPCDTPAIGNYTPPKPLEECISYEEANAPIMGNPFNKSCEKSHGSLAHGMNHMRYKATRIILD